MVNADVFGDAYDVFVVGDDTVRVTDAFFVQFVVAEFDSVAFKTDTGSDVASIVCTVDCAFICVDEFVFAFETDENIVDNLAVNFDIDINVGFVDIDVLIIAGGNVNTANLTVELVV